LQHSYINLLFALKKYNPFVAVFLLALYAFIATPTHLWHHHTPKKNQASKTTSAFNTKTSIAKDISQNSESNCSICSHNYSFYTNVDIPTYQYNVVKHFSVHANFTSNFIGILPSINVNKGPPSIV
jgi:hypothetical protein